MLFVGIINLSLCCFKFIDLLEYLMNKDLGNTWDDHLLEEAVWIHQQGLLTGYQKEYLNSTASQSGQGNDVPPCSFHRWWNIVYLLVYFVVSQMFTFEFKFCGMESAECWMDSNAALNIKGCNTRWSKNNTIMRSFSNDINEVRFSSSSSTHNNNS